MSFTPTTTECFDQTSKLYLTSSNKKRKTTHTTTVISPSTPPTTKEIWAWTLTADAVAPCFIRDVFEMTENTESYDFFWLNRIPCRSVELVGILIGIQIYEKKIIYSIDDGTSVIDCNHTPTSTPRTPTKRPPNSTDSSKGPLSGSDTLVPVARHGELVVVTGKVQKKYDKKFIFISNIVRCSSSNDQLIHWRKVLELHKNHYSKTEPFSIPPLKVKKSPEETVLREKPVAGPSTAVNKISGDSTKLNKPPSTSIPVPTSPQKLRHPLRLHSHDLTNNTFSIYVMHYMEHTPDATDTSSNDIAFLCTSSMAGQLVGRKDRLEETGNSTRILSTPPQTSQPPSSHIRGFSLSYLRRVPILCDLARRVVYAEVRRMRREEKKKAQGTPNGSERSSINPSVADMDSHKLGVRMKRLFKWAIVQLLKDGRIVLWDGPCRPFPDGDAWEGFSMWSNFSSSSTLRTRETVSSTIDRTTQSRITNELEEAELSDPEPHEEVYVPLKPSYLAPYVTRVIQKIRNSSAKRVRQENDVHRTLGGASINTILSCLRKDDRWRYVGQWSIEDTLMYLKEEGKVWCVAEGRWDLTL